MFADARVGDVIGSRSAAERERQLRSDQRFWWGSAQVCDGHPEARDTGLSHHVAELWLNVRKFTVGCSFADLSEEHLEAQIFQEPLLVSSACASQRHGSFVQRSRLELKGRRTLRCRKNEQLCHVKTERCELPRISTLQIVFSLYKHTVWLWLWTPSALLQVR